MSNPLQDMEKPDVIFCIGTNMTEAYPVAAMRLKKALARGAKMIVADPRRIGLSDMADLYLPLRVGSDGHCSSEWRTSSRAKGWSIRASYVIAPWRARPFSSM